ncbi:hypothetical protein GZH46_01948 [Fragariocoptes setiger]|uniref:Uncharacterized protein n=1 Tax=Fragariocoptes setiger TaxID=1670756 RepID=A0ABQ7S7X9_9ACAR|nr:hypothetical protein GZH46_01948 [Fragariocoptes setiger]
MFAHLKYVLAVAICSLVVLATPHSSARVGQVDEKGDHLGGSSGTSGTGGRVTYATRPLMSHRMMHFGKRHLSAWSPATSMSSTYDPYGLAFVLRQPNGPMLQVPRDYDRYIVDSGNDDSIDDVTRFLPASQRGNNNYGGPFMTNQRLQQSSQDSNDDSSSSTGEQPQQDSPLQRPDDELITVHTRSLNRGLSFDLPRSFISTLYGPQSMLSNPGIMNKKAEPKDNIFMHFGRR